MKPKLAKTFLAAILGVSALFAVYLVHRNAVPSAYLRVGPDQHPLAPDFSLPQLDGQRLALSQYRGRVVLLDFWATWCAPCREETPKFIELQNNYGDRGFQMIGISMDDGPRPVREFYQEFKINYPVVMGDAATGELYGGILGLPVAFLIGGDGHIYDKYVGGIDISILEKQIVELLKNESTAQHG
jgi:cytochrome c biogenesis protein CcmG, thiol:disulfide interchange protein DsbE